MNGTPALYDHLADAAELLADAAMRPGIHGKRDVLYSLTQGLESVSRAVQMIAESLRDARYGLEVTDPVEVTASTVFQASTAAEAAMHAVGALLNTKVGDLATSGLQVPDHAELNGGN